MSLKVDILKKSRELFYRNGYSNVTVDEIALGLGISKKTIYKYYSGKRQILEMIFNDFKKTLSGEVNAILDNEGLSYPKKLKQMMTRVALTLSGMRPVFFEDIQDNFPDLWDQINRYKQEAAFLRFNRLIEEGMEKGYIKGGTNKDMVVAIYASAINNLLDPHFFYQLPEKIRDGIPQNPAVIFDHALHIIYEGILTEDTVSSYHKD